MKRKVDPTMIKSLKEAYIKDTAQFHKILFYLSSIEGVSKSDITRIERLVKTEMLEAKLMHLVKEYLENNSILTKLKIHQELMAMSIKPLTFLLLIDELKSQNRLSGETLSYNY